MTVQERVLTVDGKRIQLFEAGEGPPLLYLHGAGTFWWMPVHELLARTFHVYLPVHPGFGDSAGGMGGVCRRFHPKRREGTPLPVTTYSVFRLDEPAHYRSFSLHPVSFDKLGTGSLSQGERGPKNNLFRQMQTAVNPIRRKVMKDSARPRCFES
jgi:hypothetical protein